MADTGVRTDEGVPVGKEAPGGLLLQWFSQFWEVFANANPHQTPPNTDSRPSQISQATAHLPSFMTSATMRRTETEPTRGSTFINEIEGDTSMHSPEKLNNSGTHSATAMTTAQSWGCPADSAFDDSPRQRNAPAPSLALSQSAQDDTSWLIQKMGWGNQKYEDLDATDKHQLIDVLKRSQLAQQQALERMAQTYPENIEPSVHRSFNGSAFQQMPQSLSISPTYLNNEQASMPLPSPGLNIAYHEQQTPSNYMANAKGGKKSTGPGSGRKKRRSSISAQNTSQSQVSNHTLSAASNPIANLNNDPSRTNSSIAQLAPSPQFNGMLPSVLQPESPTSYDHRPRFTTSQSASQLQGNEQRIKAMSESPTRGGNSFHAQFAQNEATSQASHQINAQIAQLQSQANRRPGPKGNTQSNQISQLKMLQEKLNQNAKSAAETDWNKQQQNQAFITRPMMGGGDMGPPPSPGSQLMPSYSQQQYQPSFGMDGQAHMQTMSTPNTPALTTSSTISNTTPDWREGPNRMMQDSPGGINMHGVPNDVSPQSVTTFGASLDPSHGRPTIMMGAPPHHEQQQLQMLQQQQQHYFSRVNSTPYPQHQVLKSPINAGNPTESSDFVNFNWNEMGTM